MITNQAQLQLQTDAKDCLLALAHQPDVSAVFGQVVRYAQQWPIHILLTQHKYLCQLILHLTKAHTSTPAVVMQEQLRTVVQVIRQRKLNMGLAWADKFDFLLFRLTKLLKQDHPTFQSTHQSPACLTQDSTDMPHNYVKEMRQNMQVLPQTQQLLNAIIQNKLLPTDNSCLGCCRLTSTTKNEQSYQISTIYENQFIPHTGQYYSVINYDQNASIDEDIRRHMCAALNAGGGYVFVNGCSDNKIVGIKFNGNEQLELLYSFINKAVTSMQPDFHKCSFVLRQLQVVNSPFESHGPSSGYSLKTDQFQQYTSESANTPPNRKRIIRLQLWPDEPRLFYIEQKIKSNKVLSSFFIPHASSIGQVQAEHIYKLLVAKQTHANRMRTKGNRYHHPCPVCLPQVSTKLLQSLSNIEVLKQSPIMAEVESKFKNMAVIVISSLKFENDFIKTFQTELQKRKILVELSKPFLKFTSNALRAVWLVSHECNFNDLNKVIKISDADGKCSGIIVTRFIQINSGIIHDSKLTRLEVVFEQMFKYKAMKQARLEKQLANGVKKSKFYTYYCFKLEIEAVFAFIYLDGQGVRCEFVKEYHFKNEHKSIN